MTISSAFDSWELSSLSQGEPGVKGALLRTTYTSPQDSQGFPSLIPILTASGQTWYLARKCLPQQRWKGNTERKMLIEPKTATRRTALKP